MNTGVERMQTAPALRELMDGQSRCFLNESHAWSKGGMGVRQGDAASLLCVDLLRATGQKYKTMERTV